MKKVLIVEDDLTIARIYQGLVRMQGFDVLMAADGELAAQALSQTRPDLVLLDLMLPKMSGVEVLKYMRAMESTRDVPVLVLTNACMGTLLDEAMQAGATRCLIKAQTPPKKLIETVRDYLGEPPVVLSAS
jgi:CheY-like chemotaxis protein